MVQIIDTFSSSSFSNMEKDRYLLGRLGSSREAVVHLYEWENLYSATYGYFTDVSRLLKPGHDLDLARRPTGGGIIFHRWDYAFSILVPSSHPLFSNIVLDNYRWINQLAYQALEKVLYVKKGGLIEEDSIANFADNRFFCMARPTKYDVMIDNKKIIGAAQRTTKNGFLHQGSIFLMKPDIDLLRQWVIDENVIASIMENTHYFVSDEKDFFELKKELKASLHKTLQKELAISEQISI